MFVLPLLLAVIPTPAAPAAAPTATEARAIVEELVACGTRHSLSSWTDPKRGIGCGRDVVVRRLEAISKASSGRLQIVVDRFEASGPRTRNAPVPMENVYGILPGTDAALARTVFIVSGHFDSMPTDILDTASDAPGADDDASGTAAVLLAAAALAPSPARATLLFAAVSGEEQGLYGGSRLLQFVHEKGFTVGGMITNDIVGATNGAADPRLRIFSEGGPDGVDSPGRQLARLVEDVNGRDRVRLVFRLDRFGRGGDHRPFVEASLPAIRFTEPLEDYHHEHQTPRMENGVEYGDLPKFLDFPFLASVALVNIRTLAEVANAPAPPKSVTLGGVVTPSAVISVEADKDPERKAFEILWRETTDPRWGVLRSVDAGGRTSLEETLQGISTDNQYFAVRSVGTNGRRSIAVPAVAAVRRPPGYVPAGPGSPPRPPEKK